jgi:hypothetical protein
VIIEQKTPAAVNVLDPGVPQLTLTPTTKLIQPHFLTAQAWVYDVCASVKMLGLARYPVLLGPAIMDLFVTAVKRVNARSPQYQALLVASIHYAALQLGCLIRAESHRAFVQGCYPGAVVEELEMAESVVRPLRASMSVPFADLAAQSISNNQKS